MLIFFCPNGHGDRYGFLFFNQRNEEIMSENKIKVMCPSCGVKGSCSENALL